MERNIGLVDNSIGSLKAPSCLTGGAGRIVMSETTILEPTSNTSAALGVAADALHLAYKQLAIAGCLHTTEFVKYK